MSAISANIARSDYFSAEAEVDLAKKHVMVRLVGVLNESADLNQVFTFISGLQQDIEEVTIDLAKIRHINSSGVREWLLFIEKLQQKLPVKFENVSEIFMDQAAIVHNLFGPHTGTSIVSFQAPYFCSLCKLREVKLLQASALNRSKGAIQVPKFSCSQCAKPLQFDGLPDEYFGFLRD